MKREPVDDLLATWEERLARVDENLLALEGDATYQVLAGTAGRRASLDGVTRARVNPALDALSELFEHRSRLAEVLDRARALWRNAGFFDKDETATEVLALLTGPSVKLGQAPLPLARRNLLDPIASGNGAGVMPEQLLRAMGHAYEVARDAVTQVARAWATLDPIMADLDRALASLRELAKEVGDTPTVGDELGAIGRDLAEYHALVAKDPLGVEASVAESMTPRLAGVRRRLESLWASKQRVVVGLGAAEDALARLRAMHAEARRAPERVRAEFGAMPIPARVDDALLAGLEEWRGKIASTAEAGRWRAADVGLARWQETLTSYLTVDTASVEAFDALLATRLELAGRLSAGRAQLQALVARGNAASTALTEQAREADALLRARPTDLTRSARVVDAFETEVVRLAQRARRGA